MKTAFISFVWICLFCTGAADWVKVGPEGVECLGDECKNTATDDEVTLLQTFRKEFRSVAVDNESEKSAMKALLLHSKEKAWQQMLNTFQILKDAGVATSKVEQNKMYERIHASPVTDPVNVDPEFQLSAFEKEKEISRVDEMRNVIEEIIYCLKPEFDEQNTTDLEKDAEGNLKHLWNIVNAEVLLKLESNKSDPDFQSVI